MRSTTERSTNPVNEAIEKQVRRVTRQRLLVEEDLVSRAFAAGCESVTITWPDQVLESKPIHLPTKLLARVRLMRVVRRIRRS